jgi:penicillin-binding protein-related factor A (putative recombinase)
MELWKAAEKEFESAFDRKGKGAFVHRLTDTAAAKATGGKRAFVGKQPSDYIVVDNGNTYFAEVKSSQDEVSFPHSNIQAYQMASARRTVKAGGTYVFFIKNLRTGHWYCVPAEVIIGSEKKSTRWADIEIYRWNLQ